MLLRCLFIWPFLLLGSAVYAQTNTEESKNFSGDGLVKAESTTVSPSFMGKVITVEQLKDEKFPNRTAILPQTFADKSLYQVTSVNQLQDVEPTSWAYEALRSLVERYGCIVGYPDLTFRGERALTRWEFAAGLNACMNKMEQLLGEGVALAQEDLESLKRLGKDFEAELAKISARIDNVESRIAYLEEHQFAGSDAFFPLVKMGGEAIIAVSSAGGGDPPGTGNAEATMNYLARLQLVSTFNGKDRLRLELESGNFDGLHFAKPSILNTNVALLSFQSATRNQVFLSSLEYRFATLGDKVVFTVKPVGFSLSTVLSANSPYFDSGRGAISRFAEAPPIFKIGNLDTGIGLDWLVSNRVRLQVAYGSNNGNNPQDGFAFGNGSHATGVQLLLLPGDDLLTGLTYVYGYSPNGRLNTFTGSAIADASGFINQRSNIHAFNATLQWRITPQVVFATWGGITGTYAEATNAFAVSTNFMFSLGFPDLFKEGNLFAVMVGQPPKLINVGGFSGSSGLGEENTTSLHFESFYRWQINNNIFITPGFFIVSNPGNIANNQMIWVATLRTTFRF